MRVRHLFKVSFTTHHQLSEAHHTPLSPLPHFAPTPCASRAEPALRLPVPDQAGLPAPHPRLLAHHLQEALPGELPGGPVPSLPGRVPVSPRRREPLQEGEREKQNVQYAGLYTS